MFFQQLYVVVDFGRGRSDQLARFLQPNPKPTYVWSCDSRSRLATVAVLYQTVGKNVLAALVRGTSKKEQIYGRDKDSGRRG